jgi:hypothetical protein
MEERGANLLFCPGHHTRPFLSQTSKRPFLLIQKDIQLTFKQQLILNVPFCVITFCL